MTTPAPASQPSLAAQPAASAASTPLPPPIQWDSNGLMVGVPYVYRADGGVDWRKMVPNEFLYVKDEFKARVMKEQGVTSGAQIDTSKTLDSQLLVLLGGWKRLLFLRGYTSLTQSSDYVSPEKAVSTCTITFAPNYETRMQPVTYSWTASASYANTSGDIPQAFLEATACNRAFSLCLRGFLNVNIVGKDEMGPTFFARAPSGAPAAGPAPDGAAVEESPIPTTGFKGIDFLVTKAKELGISFDQLKEGASTKYRADMEMDPTGWTQFSDIQPRDAYCLYGKLTAAAKGKTTKVK